MKRARDGSCCQRKDVGLEAKLFQAFLVFDTKAVLLVNDDQSELREGDVSAEYPVGADDNVRLSRFQVSENGGLLFRGLKAGKRIDFHREVCQPLTEGARMLIGE